MKLRKKKCTKCSKLKTLSRFNEIDYGWGNFKKSSWCAVCAKWMDGERNKANRKWTKKQNKLKKEFVANGGIIQRPIIGRSMMIDFTKNPNGIEIELCKGWYANDKGWRTNGKPSNYL